MTESTRSPTVCNPAWDIWQVARDAPCDSDICELSRSAVSGHMTFAVPSPAHLLTVARLRPLVEVGAGTGYWAWCLRQMGVDIVAYDLFPPSTHPAAGNQWRGVMAMNDARNAWFDCHWSEVLRADADVTARHPDRTLLMVWPYGPMARRALDAYAGSRLVFIGEWSTESTNDAGFFDQVRRHWVRTAAMPMPRWSGVRDELLVFRR